MNYRQVNDLEVYQLSELLPDHIWNEYDIWDYKAQRTIGLQVIRSADSIAANIAEGVRQIFRSRQKEVLHYGKRFI
jgi:four helix bundle protein